MDLLFDDVLVDNGTLHSVDIVAQASVLPLIDNKEALSCIDLSNYTPEYVPQAEIEMESVNITFNDEPLFRTP